MDQELAIESNPFPKPDKVSTTLLQQGQTLVLQRKVRSGWTLIIFLGIWLTVWSIGCVAMIAKQIQHFEWGFLAFMTPFLLGEIGALTVIFYQLFGYEELSISRDGVSKYLTVLLYKKLRTLKLTEINTVDDLPTGTTVNNRQIYAVTIVAGKTKMRFASGAPDGERLWILGEIKSLLSQLKVGTSPAGKNVHTGLMVAATDGSGADDPEGGTWNVTDDGRSVVLTIGGKFSLVGAIFLLVFNAIWNGIVAKGLLEAFHSKGIVDKLFLLPFALVGVLMFVILLGILFATWISMQWRVDGNELVRRFKLPIIAFTKRWPTDRVNKMRLEKYGNNRNGGQMRWRIVLLDHSDSVGTISGLRKPQAQKMLETLKKRFSRWVVDRDESLES